jgi:phage gp45-like
MVVQATGQDSSLQAAPTVISVSTHAELRNQLMTEGDTFYMNNWIRQMCLTDNQHVL